MSFLERNVSAWNGQLPLILSFWQDDIAKEVKELLALKAQYKVMTGTEWSASKPGASSCDRAPVTDASMPTLLSVPCMSVNVAACFPQELTVVDSPSVSTASGSDAVSSLTGDSISDSRSDITATVATMKSSAEDVHAEMQRQGDRVRRLKSEKASKVGRFIFLHKFFLTMICDCV